MKKIILIALGSVCLALGTVGVVLPILPTVPFYMAAAFCYAKSSQRLHSWFVNTALYKKHLSCFAEHRGMLLKTKVSVITTVTLLMGFGFFMMWKKGIWVPCIILAVVWVCHIIYFVFFVRTIKRKVSAASAKKE